MAVDQGGVGRSVSRREVLRRGAVAGALAWAAPAVVSVPAHAQGADGTPECTCHPAAFGLRVMLVDATSDVPPVNQTFSHATGPNQDPDPVVDTDDDLEDSTGVRAATVDSETGTCGANASAGSVTIDSSVLLGSGNPVITATVLSSTVSADPDGGPCDPSGGSSVVTIDNTTETITGDPNQTITVIPGMTIIVNEQTTTCPNGREDLVVNALRVTLTAGQLTLEVIVANSTVESCCDC